MHCAVPVTVLAGSHRVSTPYRTDVATGTVKLMPSPASTVPAGGGDVAVEATQDLTTPGAGSEPK